MPRNSLLLLLIAVPALGAAPRDSVNQIAADFWEWQLREYPEEATSIGDHRFDDRLTDPSSAAVEQRAAAAAKFTARLDALPAPAGEDAITTDVLRLELSQVVDSARLHLERIDLDQMDGPQVGFQRRMANHPRRDAHDLANLLARYHAFPAYLNAYSANLRAGLAEKRTMPRVIVERVIAQLHDLLAIAPEKSPFAAADKPADRSQLAAAAGAELYPAYRALLVFLEKEYLPAARSEVGLWALPDGAAIYSLAIQQRTTTRRTPDELHQLGLHELGKIESELHAIERRLGMPAEPRAVAEWLAKNPRAHFRDRADELAEYRRTVDRFRARLPAEFTRLPRAQMAIAPMPAFMEQHAPGAYYDFPSEDGKRPGTFYVNTWHPETQPRYKMEALAAHEGVPGHHLQVSLALELTQLPTVRRRADVAAFTEGWGMYAERLVDEAGLYSDDLARYGMLAAQAWRAARLVVDTGMHALKWPRARAIDFLLAHSPAARPEVEQEIDRYIVWPAQGMAYMVGELEIFAARADAEQALGKRFSRKAFHDRLLASGAMPLATLRRVMADWARR